MDEVMRAIDRIRSIRGALIDCNIGQGRDVVFIQFQMRFGEVVKKMSDVEADVSTIQEDITKLHTWVAPHCLPNDYVFFLEFYGGLLIKTPHYNLLVDGLGPMTEEWYSFIMGDDALYENGFLLISSLPFKEARVGQYVYFFLDLAGIIQQYCVVGIETQNSTGINLVPTLQNPHTHADRWTKHSDSFTEWLEQLADTNGSFGYV